MRAHLRRTPTPKTSRTLPHSSGGRLSLDLDSLWLMHSTIAVICTPLVYSVQRVVRTWTYIKGVGGEDAVKVELPNNESSEEFGRIKVWRELVRAVAGLSDPLRRLSDERRRDREANGRSQMRFLSPVARELWGPAPLGGMADEALALNLALKTFMIPHNDFNDTSLMH